MRLLVVGASGKTGQIVLEQLAKTKHTTTGLVRSAEQESLLQSLGAKTLIGDLEDGLLLPEKSFDAIIFVAGSRGKNVQGVDFQGAIDIIDKAVFAKINRFLYIGSINAGKKPEQYIQELKDYYEKNNEPVPERLLANTKKPGYHAYVDIKTQVEQHLVSSGLQYTILRAGLLTLEPGTGCVDLTEGTLNAFGVTSRYNIANGFISILENKHTYQKTYTVLDGQTPIRDAFLQRSV